MNSICAGVDGAYGCFSFAGREAFRAVCVWGIHAGRHLAKLNGMPILIQQGKPASIDSLAGQGVGFRKLNSQRLILHTGFCGVRDVVGRGNGHRLCGICFIALWRDDFKNLVFLRGQITNDRFAVLCGEGLRTVTIRAIRACLNLLELDDNARFILELEHTAVQRLLGERIGFIELEGDGVVCKPHRCGRVRAISIGHGDGNVLCLSIAGCSFGSFPQSVCSQRNVIDSGFTVISGHKACGAVFIVIINSVRLFCELDRFA